MNSVATTNSKEEACDHLFPMECTDSDGCIYCGLTKKQVAQPSTHKESWEDLHQLLLDLVGIANRSKAGQVTHKIEEIEQFLRLEKERLIQRAVALLEKEKFADDGGMDSETLQYDEGLYRAIQIIREETL
jgi:hypothetical protein